MSIPNPTAGVGKATGSPLVKVVLWLIVAYGIYATWSNWWNGQEWFLLDFLDQLWVWSLEISEAIRT
jgi:hypothetical protein